MSSWALNNVTAPDQYSPASTLEQLPVLDHVNIDVYGGSIFWQLKLSSDGREQTGQWDQEVFMISGSRSLYRAGICGIRVRAGVPLAQLPSGQAQAQFTVEAVQQ